jgi:predicted RNA polymerase sigma factor
MGHGCRGVVKDGEGGARAYGTAEAVARTSYGKLVAFLTARTHNVAAAEDALADAFAAALEEWPRNGCPAQPEAWLLTVARRRMIDAARRRRTSESAAPELQLLAQSALGDDLELAFTEPEIPDRRLALLFVCAHPAIDAAARGPLMLQAVLGLDAKTIASAFLTSPAAMAKRLVRAKEKIRQAGVPFRIPDREELPGRLEFVLDTIYAAFTEGWLDAHGTDAARRDLTQEAIFLARLVTELLPDQPEAPGLLALMLYAEGRRSARRSPEGEYIPFDLQDPALWDAQMIAEAETLLRKAGEMESIGRYQLEAALQSAHVYRRRTGQANWPAVARLYGALEALTGSPVVAVNRALALAESEGAAAGLEALAPLSSDARVAAYQPYWAARAELLARAGRYPEARRAYEIAMGLERDSAVRGFLEKRRAALPG